MCAAALALAATLTAVAASGAAAQGAQVPFGASEHDATLPVEISADTLSLDQASGTAIYTGSVIAGQGALRLAADRLEVFYAEGDAGSGITRLVATGNVALTNGAEAAEAQRAVYTVADGIVEMEGDVLLTQGPNVLASQKLRVDLVKGTGRLEGRVQTILVPGSAGASPGTRADGRPGAAPGATP
jgi:lipopolysaccharide export system protein LptA